jgi:XTP/dITP diphosphohydrolase
MLVLATRNVKKGQELRDLLADSGIELIDLTRWPDAPEVQESGSTFQENATIKATQCARFVERWVLAEDSGLVVPALKGRPGVHSARYAGPHGDDAANNVRLLAEMADLPDERRAAYYACVVALADPAGKIRAIADGRCHGVITHHLLGSGGFGYDPLFRIPEYHRTFGELSPRVKHAISHRARAIDHLLRQNVLQLITAEPGSPREE